MRTHIKILNFLIIISSILVFTSCGPQNMTEQVEDLIQSDNIKERKQIAYALADSLDIMASEILIKSYDRKVSEIKTKNRIIAALKNMLTRYSEIENESTHTSIDKCITYITNPSEVHSISNEEKINLIIYGLKIKNSSKSYKKSLVNSAKNHGNNAMIEIINQWNRNKNSKELLYAINLYQNKAINYLSGNIVEDKNAIELLARIGEPAVNSMKKKMRSSQQSVRFAAGDVLVEMLKYHPNAIDNLTSAINNNGVKTIAENYPFYIRLGQGGTENILLKALRQNFTIKMCEDYLNCGSKILDEGATSIAYDYGYIVTPGFGTHYGPKWGSGN